MLLMALSSQKVGVKKKWYDKVKQNASSWDCAWEEKYVSLRCDGIWVTFVRQKASIAIPHPDIGYWYHPFQILDLTLKEDHYYRIKKRFFFMWCFMTVQYWKQNQCKAPDPQNKRGGKRPPLTK